MASSTSKRVGLPILCILATLMSLSRVGANTIVAKSSSWNLCASKTYPVSIKDVVISPDPIVAGDLAVFSIPAFTEEELKGGTVVITVSFHGLKVHTEKDDICAKSACPISGEFTLNNAEALPSYTPPGSYKLKLQVLDTDGKELACASVSFSIVWKAELQQILDDVRAVHRKFGM